MGKDVPCIWLQTTYPAGYIVHRIRQKQMPGTMQWDMLVSKYEIALDLEGRVGDDLERSDVTGVRGDWRWWNVTQLADVDPPIIDHLTVVPENVLNGL